MSQLILIVGIWPAPELMKYTEQLETTHTISRPSPFGGRGGSNPGFTEVTIFRGDCFPPALLYFDLVRRLILYLACIRAHEIHRAEVVTTHTISSHPHLLGERWGRGGGHSPTQDLQRLQYYFGGDGFLATGTIMWDRGPRDQHVTYNTHNKLMQG